MKLIVITSNKSRARTMFPDAYKVCSKLKEVYDVLNIFDFRFYTVQVDWDEDYDGKMSDEMEDFIKIWNKEKEKYLITSNENSR